jgi:saccharopine dehydrogenase-like NADP-dependent oxidoreductase
MKVVVLGCGKVGCAVARDLSTDTMFEVTVADSSPGTLQALEHTLVQTVEADLSKPEAVSELAAASDIVVGTLPGFLGFRSIRASIEAGRDVVDLSYFPEDAYELDEMARARGVRVFVDFGIAPGFTNLVFGHSRSVFAKLESFVCYVGGLPVERYFPWEYQAPFSPVDVLEEYTRPARFVMGGHVVTEPALSLPEFIDFRSIGTLEGFLTDGLRTLLRYAGEVDYMAEKTLRYPGYRDKIVALRESGFLNPQPVNISGRAISPIEVTSKLLFRAWEQKAGDEDFTAIRIVSTGLDETGRRMREIWSLLDRFDKTRNITATARTSAFMCMAGIRLLAEDLWRQTGICPPEVVGGNRKCLDFIIGELLQRGVNFEVTREPVMY